MAAPGVRRLALAATMLFPPSVMGEPNTLLVIAGIGGEGRFRDVFYEQAVSLATAAETRLGLAAAQVHCLTENPERDPAMIDGPSTREEIARVLESIAAESQSGAVFIVLIGHGSYRSGEARFNLPGPDLTPALLAAWLAPLSHREVVVINTASASGAFVRELSGQRRVVVTATKSGHERNETMFGEYFIAALIGDVADVDKDGRASVLEAFEYARTEVARFYETENRLQTEHAVLDDDGDSTGTDAPAARGAGDGGLAARVFLASPVGDRARAATVMSDPALAGLYAERDRIESLIEVLRTRKAELPPDEYADTLEALILELALMNESIEKRTP